LTLAEVTPGTSASACSTRLTQEAQVMPVMGIYAFWALLALDLLAI